MKLDAKTLQEIRQFEERNGVTFESVVLQEHREQPVFREDAFTRMGLDRSAYKAVAKPTELKETKQEAVTIPDGMHQKLIEALAGSSEGAGETVYSKLANAFA